MAYWRASAPQATKSAHLTHHDVGSEGGSLISYKEPEGALRRTAYPLAHGAFKVIKAPAVLGHAIAVPKDNIAPAATDVVGQDGVFVGGASGAVRLERAVVRPPRMLSRRSFIPLARWEGSVTEVYGTYFVADVIDLRTGETATADFDLTDVASDDRSLVEAGALFYWTIGYETRESGQRSRSSVLLFRRLGQDADG